MILDIMYLVLQPFQMMIVSHTLSPSLTLKHETDGKIIFTITLSKPLEDDLYLTMNTVDDTVAGEDYAGKMIL